MKKSRDTAADILAVIILSVLCFVGLFAAAFYATLRFWLRFSVRYGDADVSDFPTVLWLVPTIAGAIGAIVGPMILKNASSSGAGSLKEIRARSKRDNDGKV